MSSPTSLSTRGTFRVRDRDMARVRARVRVKVRVRVRVRVRVGVRVRVTVTVTIMARGTEKLVLVRVIACPGALLLVALEVSRMLITREAYSEVRGGYRKGH